jgi:hypothetical protein
MVTTAEFDDESRIASFTENMTCTNKIAGFTGGVLLAFIDESGSVLGTSGVQQNGINQAPLFGAAHRTITWNGLTPEGTKGMLLAQFWDPHNRLGDGLLNIGDAFLVFAENVLSFGVFGQFTAVNSWAKGWCDANPDWCTAMEVLGLIVGVAMDVIAVLITIG